MPITVIATPGAANANSFVTATEMSSYCEARLNAAAWTGADAQLPALVMATRELSLLTYVGTRATSTQALAWPRRYAQNPDAPVDLDLGDLAVPEYDDDEIPQRIKDATCELALALLVAGTKDLIAADPDRDLIRKRVDIIEREWADPLTRAEGYARFPVVVRLVRPLLTTASTAMLVDRV